MERLKSRLRILFDIAKKTEMRILPANLAFFLVLSIIPIFTLIGFTASFFSISIETLTSFMAETFPKEVGDILIPFIDGQGIDLSVGFFMVTGFVLASNGPHSIIIASNTLYHQENSSYLKRRIKALLLTIILVLLLVFIIVVLAFGNMILKYLLDLAFFKNFGDKIYIIFVLLKWPTALILILFTIKIIYTIAPDKNIKSKYVNLGSLFTTLGWIIVTAIYSYYVTNFANYDIFYGSLSNIVILMMWIYILSYILVLGIAINVTYYRMEKIGTDNND